MVMTTGSQAQPEREGDLIDLRTLWLIVRRRMKPFLIVAGIVFLIGFAITLLLPSTYTSTSTVLIDRRVMAVADVQSVLSGLPADSASVDTEVQVLRSPALIRQVVTRLKLEQDPEFNVALQPPGFFDPAIKAVKGLFASADTGAKSPLEKTTAAVINNLTVARQGLTYVIGVSFDSEDATTSTAVANAIAEQYLANQVAEKRAAARTARNYLNARLSGLRSEVQGKENAAQALRARAGLPTAENGSTFDEMAIQDLSRQATSLESDLAEKRAQLAAAQAAGANPAAIPQVIESNVIRDLRAQRAALLARNADTANRYGPLHPETLKAKDELTQVDAELRAEMGRIAASLRNDVSVAQGRLGVIRGALASQRGETVGTARAGVAVGQYEREATATRGTYEDFLRRAGETATTEDLAKPDASIIALAKLPTKPSGPPRLILLILSAMVGGLAGLLAIIAAEILDVKISSGADVTRYLDLHRIASIPGVPRGGRLATLITDKPMSSYAEAFRTAAGYVRKGAGVAASGQAAVVMVTSALPHEGKTSVATGLALSIARAGDKVLLIDTDLRRPHAMSALGQAPRTAGIGELMAGTASPADAITRDPDQRIDILGVGQGAQDVEMFRTDQLANLLAKLKPLYGTIVIDTPPVLAISDARHMAGLVDSVVFVTRWRRTSRFAARAAVDALRDANAPLVGVVLNGVDLKAQGFYARDDSLAFYSAYRQYYTE